MDNLLKVVVDNQIPLRLEFFVGETFEIQVNTIDDRCFVIFESAFFHEFSAS